MESNEMLRLIGTKNVSLLEAGKINEPDFRVEIIIITKIVGFTELVSSTAQTNKQTNKQLSNHRRRVRARLFSDLRDTPS